MKYEIIINPKNNEHCGKCTYKKMNTKGNNCGLFKEWYCMLFDKILVAWDVFDKEQKPTRCGDCKILTKNFINMPELEEN